MKHPEQGHDDSATEGAPRQTAGQDRLLLEEFRLLVSHREGPCVSLFMSTHRAGPPIRQDPIRLKNLGRAAEQSLIDRGHRAAAVREWLLPIESLVRDDDFWRRQSDGLAVFLAPRWSRRYRLPLRFDEKVVVGDRFHVSPLIRYFTQDERFYVLALSQQGTRLLRCTRDVVERVELPDAPPSMTETPGYERRETQLQFEAIAPPGKGGTALFHGHGSSSDASDADVERYFRAVDRSLCDAITDNRVPVILAGVEYLLPLYRGLTRYPSIHPAHLTGSPEDRSDDDLHRDGWRLIEPGLAREKEKAWARVHEALGTGRGSDRVTDVIPAAVQGRVDVLFTPRDLHVWGRFDPQTQTVAVHEEAGPDDEDLLDLGAIQTVLNGGRVYTMTAAELSTAVAAFRY